MLRPQFVYLFFAVFLMGLVSATPISITFTQMKSDSGFKYKPDLAIVLDDDHPSQFNILYQGHRDRQWDQWYVTSGNGKSRNTLPEKLDFDVSSSNIKIWIRILEKQTNNYVTYEYAGPAKDAKSLAFPARFKKSQKFIAYPKLPTQLTGTNTVNFGWAYNYPGKAKLTLYVSPHLFDADAFVALLDAAGKTGSFTASHALQQLVTLFKKKNVQMDPDSDPRPKGAFANLVYLNLNKEDLSQKQETQDPNTGPGWNGQFQDGTDVPGGDYRLVLTPFSPTIKIQESEDDSGTESTKTTYSSPDAGGKTEVVVHATADVSKYPAQYRIGTGNGKITINGYTFDMDSKANMVTVKITRDDLKQELIQYVKKKSSSGKLILLRDSFQGSLGTIYEFKQVSGTSQSSVTADFLFSITQNKDSADSQGTIFTIMGGLSGKGAFGSQPAPATNDFYASTCGGTGGKDVRAICLFFKRDRAKVYPQGSRLRFQVSRVDQAGKPTPSGTTEVSYTGKSAIPGSLITYIPSSGLFSASENSRPVTASVNVNVYLIPASSQQSQLVYSDQVTAYSDGNPTLPKGQVGPYDPNARGTTESQLDVSQCGNHLCFGINPGATGKFQMRVVLTYPDGSIATSSYANQRSGLRSFQIPSTELTVSGKYSVEVTVTPEQGNIYIERGSARITVFSSNPAVPGGPGPTPSTDQPAPQPGFYGPECRGDARVQEVYHLLDANGEPYSLSASYTRGYCVSSTDCAKYIMQKIATWVIEKGVSDDETNTDYREKISKRFTAPSCSAGTVCCGTRSSGYDRNAFAYPKGRIIEEDCKSQTTKASCKDPGYPTRVKYCVWNSITPDTCAPYGNILEALGQEQKNALNGFCTRQIISQTQSINERACRGAATDLTAQLDRGAYPQADHPCDFKAGTGTCAVVSTVVVPRT